MLSEADLLAMEMAEYNVLVRMDPVEAKSPGGIVLPEALVDQNAMARDVGTLVKVGDLAFGYAEWSPPTAGDRVLVAQYDGKLYDVNGKKYRVLKDKSVVGFWRQPAALAAAA